MLDVFLGNLPVFLYPPMSYNEEDDFLAFPEETQQLLLKKGADSAEALHQEMELLRRKE